MRGTLPTFSPQHSVYDAAALALIAGQFEALRDKAQVLTALNKIVKEKMDGNPLANIEELSRFPLEQQEQFLSEALKSVLKIAPPPASAPDVKVDSNPKTPDEKILVDLRERLGVDLPIKGASQGIIMLTQEDNEWRVSLPKNGHEAIIAARYSGHYGLVHSFSLSQPPEPPVANKIYLQVVEDKDQPPYVKVMYFNEALSKQETREIDAKESPELVACLEDEKNKPLNITHLRPFFPLFSQNIPALTGYEAVVENIKNAKDDAKEENFAHVVQRAACKEIATRLGIDEKHKAAQKAFIEYVTKSKAEVGSEAEMAAIGNAAAEFFVNNKRKLVSEAQDHIYTEVASAQEAAIQDASDSAKNEESNRVAVERSKALQELSAVQAELSRATVAQEEAEKQEQQAAVDQKQDQQVLAKQTVEKQKEAVATARANLKKAQVKLEKIDTTITSAGTAATQKWRQKFEKHNEAGKKQAVDNKSLFGRFADEKAYKAAFVEMFAMIAKKKGGCLYVNGQDLAAISDKLLAARKIISVWKTRSDKWKENAPKEMKPVLDAVDTDHTLTAKGNYSGKVVFNKDKATVDFTFYKNGSLLLSMENKNLEYGAKLAFAQMQKKNKGNPVTAITLSHIDPPARKAEVYAAFKAAGFKTVKIDTAKVAEEKEEKHAEEANRSLLRL